MAVGYCMMYVASCWTEGRGREWVMACTQEGSMWNGNHTVCLYTFTMIMLSIWWGAYMYLCEWLLFWFCGTTPHPTPRKHQTYMYHKSLLLLCSLSVQNNPPPPHTHTHLPPPYSYPHIPTDIISRWNRLDGPKVDIIAVDEPGPNLWDMGMGNLWTNGWGIHGLNG